MATAVDWMKSMYRKEYERNPVFTLFLTILIVFFIVFVISVVITGGDTFYYILNSTRSDIFSDHFNSVVDSRDDPYTKHCLIYPPLVTIFYFVIGHFTAPFVGAPAGETITMDMLRNSQMGIMSFLFIVLVALYVLYVLFSKIIKEKGVRKELMFLFAVLLAYPFLFALERGNSIIMALVFCLFFLLGYRSENKYVRYASYIALGCAAGIKLYPVIFGLLILRERQHREFAICAAIVAALMFIPFIFTDGNPLMLFDNVFSYSSTVLGVTNIEQILVGVLQIGHGVAEGTVSIISYATVGLFTILSFIVIIFDKEMKFWKVVALLGCNLVLGFGLGIQYQIIYMIPAILFFLAAEKETTRENLFYIVCFAMTIALIPGIDIAFFSTLFAGVDAYPSAVIGAMESVFVIIIAIALLREGLLRIYRSRNGTVEQSADIVA